MLLRVILLFLIAMAILGMFGKWRFPDALRRLGGQKCGSCGRHRMGKGPCPCKRG